MDCEDVSERWLQSETFYRSLNSDIAWPHCWGVEFCARSFALISRFDVDLATGCDLCVLFQTSLGLQLH
jgi:hypothetical protein